MYKESIAYILTDGLLYVFNIYMYVYIYMYC
jgi:hypothetical protein